MKYSILIVLLYLSLTLQSDPTPISVNEKVNFDTHENDYFKFTYERKDTTKNCLFFIYYAKEGDLTIEISNEEGTKDFEFQIYENDGYIYFPFIDGSVTYVITFISEFENAFGSFGVLPSDTPLDFGFSDFKFDRLEVKSDLEMNPLILKLENNLGMDLMKEFTHDNEDTFIISMKEENDTDYKEIKNDLLYFKNGTTYLIKIEFWEREDERGSYFIFPFSIIDFDINNITMKEFSLGPMLNEKYQYVYTKINLTEYDRFHIETFGDGPKIQYFFLNDESQLDSFPENIQYLNFSIIPSHKFEKPENTSYMILFIDFDSLDFCIYFSKPMPLDLNEERQINETNYYFKLNYTKKSEKNEVLYIFYDLQNEEECGLKIDSNEYFLDKKGTVDYLLNEKDDEYFIFFYSLSPVKGKFKIVSSEYEFSLDAKEEIFIPKNDFQNYHSEIIFSFINIDKNYLKLFSSKDTLKDIISYKKKDKDFVPMENAVFLLEKGESLKIKVNISKSVRISNLDEDENKVEVLNETTYKFPNPLNKILKVNYLKTPYFQIEGDDSNNYYIANATEDQYNAIPKGIEKLSFSRVNYAPLTFSKPYNFYYAVLINEIMNNSSLTVNELEKPLNYLAFDSKEYFDSFRSNYKFNYPEGKKKEMSFLIYNNENGKDFNIEIHTPDDSFITESFSGEKKDGIFGFELEENGDYKISFDSAEPFKGTFRLVNTGNQFEMNINEDIIFDSSEIEFKPSPIVMVFYPNESVVKKFLVGDNGKQLDFVQIYDDKSKEYKNLSFNLFAFQVGKAYKIKIDYNESENNTYKMENINITNYTEKLEDLPIGKKTFNNTELNIKFFKLDFSKYKKFEYDIKTNDTIIKIAYADNDVNLTTIINDLTFEELSDKETITVNSNKKGILMIEFNPGETEIEFKGIKEGGENEKDNNNKDNGDLTLILAIAIPIGIILLLIIIFLICRCCKRGSTDNIDIESKDDGQKTEVLMPDTV